MRNLIRAVSRVPSLFPVKLITVPCRGLNQLLCRTTLPKLSSQHMTCSSHLLSIIHGKIAVCVLEQTAWKHSSFNREKGKKTSDDDDDDFDLKKEVLDPNLLFDVNGKDTKIVKTKVNSLRLDAFLKAGLGVSKNKAEVAFYESRIRINGEKILKKSTQMHEGDEIDLVRGFNDINPEFLDVSRVLIVSIENGDEDRIPVILKSYKLLTIENYPEPYKRTSNE